MTHHDFQLVLLTSNQKLPFSIRSIYYNATLSTEPKEQHDVSPCAVYPSLLKPLSPGRRGAAGVHDRHPTARGPAQAGRRAQATPGSEGHSQHLRGVVLPLRALLRREHQRPRE